MRYSRFTFFLGGCLAAFTCMMLAPIAFASYIGEPMTIVFMPFEPIDEIKLQAVIAREEAGASTDDERLKLLPSIETRAALEDYRRLHYELG